MGAKRATTNQIEEVLIMEYLEHRDKFYRTLIIKGQFMRFEVDNEAAGSRLSVSTVRKYCPNHYNQQIYN